MQTAALGSSYGTKRSTQPRRLAGESRDRLGLGAVLAFFLGRSGRLKALGGVLWEVGK